jgi:hypothetical protein
MTMDSAMKPAIIGQRLRQYFNLVAQTFDAKVGVS